MLLSLLLSYVVVWKSNFISVQDNDDSEKTTVAGSENVIDSYKIDIGDIKYIGDQNDVGDICNSDKKDIGDICNNDMKDDKDSDHSKTVVEADSNETAKTTEHVRYVPCHRKAFSLPRTLGRQWSRIVKLIFLLNRV